MTLVDVGGGVGYDRCLPTSQKTLKHLSYILTRRQHYQSGLSSAIHQTGTVFVEQMVHDDGLLLTPV